MDEFAWQESFEQKAKKPMRALAFLASLAERVGFQKYRDNKLIYIGILKPPFYNVTPRCNTPRC
jgi:hypothetical protein